MKNYKYEDNILEIIINKKWKMVTFEGYDFVSKIGEGANGIVLKAKHIITQRVDAIKIWLPNKSSRNGKVSEQQYLQEIRKVAKIKNHNIVTIYDAKIIDNEIYMCVMEYIEGESLKEWIKNDYGIETRIDVCKRILETVLEYQRVGVIHGDLHGGNIIIDGENNIHLIDFGTSLFGHDNQSKERESNFIFDLVKKLLDRYFVETCFEIKNYNIRDKITAKDDSRRYEPLLITKTLAHYVEMVKIKLMAQKLTDIGVIIEYCTNVSEGIYFNIDGILEELLSWNDIKSVKQFSKILVDNIGDKAFPTENVNEEDIFYTSLYIYYEIFKENKNKMNFEETEIYIMKHHRSDIQPEYKKYISELNNDKSNTYIEYHSNLSCKIMDMNHVYQIDSKNRAILSYLIESIYSENLILMLYKIWQRMNEIWLDKSLHNRILKMSNVLIMNGGIPE